MRPGEVDGREYFFLAADEFQRRIDAGEFEEWVEFAGNRYGTLRSEIDRLLAKCGSGKSKVLSATIWVTDIRNRPAMNEVWSAWVDKANLPARACVEAKLADLLLQLLNARPQPLDRLVARVAVGHAFSSNARSRSTCSAISSRSASDRGACSK